MWPPSGARNRYALSCLNAALAFAVTSSSSSFFAWMENGILLLRILVSKLGKWCRRAKLQYFFEIFNTELNGYLHFFWMKKIKLYDYQQKMLEEIINVLTTKEITRYRKKKGYEEGNSVIVQMPTGTGKTYVMASVVKWFLDNYEKGEVWIVAHRRELVEQMQQTLCGAVWQEENGA